MTRTHRSLRAAMMLALVARNGHAQAIAARAEVFSTIGGVVGATPMLIDNVRHLGAHAGFRADAGLQRDRLGVAIGGRLWELAPTKTFGGRGLDVFITGEWGVSFDTRSMVRASLGGGVDDIDGGHGPERAGTGRSGVNYSLGFAREIFVPAGERVILSADIVMPNVNAGVNGRRLPVVELGFGYRFRDFNPIAALPSR
ncbi:hypothetical protein BH09GEM1_BH09GEM1_30990 [soil metagenome]